MKLGQHGHGKLVRRVAFTPKGGCPLKPLNSHPSRTVL